MAEPRLTMRTLNPEDLRVLLELNKQLAEQNTVERQELSKEMMEKFLAEEKDPGLLAMGFEDENRNLVGAALLVSDGERLLQWFEDTFNAPETLFVYAVIVVKEAQGKGVGREIMKKIYSMGRILGKSRVMLDVNNRNKRAYDWYLREGFEELASQVYMLKKL
jgi:GNAT superfamily N-acetyltransferase